MTNQLNALAPALDMLSKQIKVLPATGGAIEDLDQPDIEETEDLLVNRDNGDITEYGETQPSLDNLYRPTPPIYRAEKQLYHYFIDGSRKTYYLGTGIENNRAFPIELAQVGAAIIQRDERGMVRALDIKHRLLLIVPKGPLGVSDTLWRDLETLNTPDGFLRVIDSAKDTPNKPGKTAVENLRAHAQGIASDYMHNLEIDAIKLTDGYRNDNCWLILDGGINWGQFLGYPWMIGVAKNFSKNPRFRFGKSRAVPRDITQIVSKLPYAHRTAAFSTGGGKVAFWYVRLRKPEEVQYALQGVVKVELPLRDRKPADTELIDLISRTLVAERNVTPYGQDQRWHCHLYPIFQAEQAIKTRFYSQQVIRGMIRWPRNIEQEITND